MSLSRLVVEGCSWCSQRVLNKIWMQVYLQLINRGFNFLIQNNNNDFGGRFLGISVQKQSIKIAAWADASVMIYFPKR